jgi:uncharacterized membrane protein YkvA (DUF1232 family)
MTSSLSRQGLVSRLIGQARLAVRLLREPHVPWLVKAVPILALLYLVSPFDLAPDFLPLIGQVDDVVIVVAALESFLRLCPPAAAAFHQAAIARRDKYSPMPATDVVIDAEWRRD